MDTEERKASPDHNTTEHDVSFSQVTAVVTDWMLDFLFVSLCRNFKDGSLEEFDKNMSSYEAFSDGLPQNDKVLVCAFLGRVMHGNQLDVVFEEDCKVTPLMSALKIWNDLKESVEDEGLAKNMTILLFVQSVAVCLEKGSNASFVIEWFEENLDFPSTLRVKLRTVVAQKDNYHPLLKSFSYSRLLETTQTFLDAFLQKNPCDYLLKAGTKAVQSSGNRDTLKVAGPKDKIQTSMKPTAEVYNESKRKLLSTKISDLWEPESCKKSVVCLARISKKVLPNGDAMDTTKNNVPRRARTKWTREEDKQLIAGVKRHGLGQWSHILQDFDFGERTGTMLKDRWRTLRKAHVV
uniref:Telomeric repeat binding factor (NIMA-interacting) 1 n=1 Tax=Neogobius melanostomus TaxID=47308 RepID=A0A8C6UC32_9GOBI